MVISLVPTYQQHTAIPESLGAQVRELRLREEDGWLPDMDELRRLADGGVKLIALVNPNNPTGSLLDEARFAEIVAVAREHGAWILADEVYRGIDQAGERHVAVLRRPVRAHGRGRQHVQGLLAGRSATRLGRCATRRARGRQPAPRLLGDQRRDGGRPPGRDRARGPGMRCSPGTGRSCARTSRSSTPGSPMSRASTTSDRPPGRRRFCAMPSICHRRTCASACWRRRASCSPRAAHWTSRGTCGSGTRTTRRCCASAWSGPPRFPATLRA